MNQYFERRYIIGGIFITLILILLGRLFYIQIIDDRYALSASKNVIRPDIINPARGTILDRNGKTLVTNELVYDVDVTPKEIKPFDTIEFCKLLGIDKAEFDKRLAKARKYSPNLQSPFEKQLSPQLYASLQERLSEFQGFRVVPHPIRSYPDSTAAQFLGYIGEVNDNTIAKSGGRYRLGDYIGISGVEKQYENVLRGQRGVTNWMVDSKGNQKGSYANGAYDTLAVPGEKLTSSLDIQLQKLGEKLMRNKAGSIVAIEPSTGEILAFVSTPSYDPNLLVGHDRSANYSRLNDNPYNPFQVRPIQAFYPPGSSFKPLDALIAIQEGLITPQTTYNCPGYYVAGNRRIPCFHGERHGLVNLSSAIAQSCNGYFDMVFEKLINRLGPKKTDSAFTAWRNKVAMFGLGGKLDLDLPGELAGLLPKASLYDKMYKYGGWRSSTIISLGIGQGELGATPLQLANIEATIANRGFFYRPHLIKAIGDKQIIRKEYTAKNFVGVDSEYFAPVIDGMQAVVDHGTAAASKIPGIIMCGKTGTAQVNGEDNSVFVAFAPRDNPKIAIAVIVENGGQGASWAAPIASFMVEKYLRDSITARPSGIDPERYINANLMPDINLYISQQKRRARLDSARRARVDSIKKAKAIQSASNKNKKPVVPNYLTAIKPKDDE
ncbi:penicillin-binding protein 2 [Mucilaginibacter sp. dw_454]|uniref:penicillin-binding protein 2 n=1 Tax=Mucilaginibacter sp. dw_454 TaxID=2720079 RepID=UPI001BD214CB|nr:penicillin-binding protein 2 [Mucilaginibacter sp. dw_454]